jgi:hypothetical protein
MRSKLRDQFVANLMTNFSDETDAAQLTGSGNKPEIAMQDCLARPIRIAMTASNSPQELCF